MTSGGNGSARRRFIGAKSGLLAVLTFHALLAGARFGAGENPPAPDETAAPATPTVAVGPNPFPVASRPAPAVETASIIAPGAGAEAASARDPSEYGPIEGDVLAYAPRARASLPAVGLDAPDVPKTLPALAAQLGPGFQCAKRGQYLVGSDVPEADFGVLVDGILAYVSSALLRSFFDAASEGPVTIYVFRDTDSYTDSLGRIFGIRPISPYGHYANTPNYLVVNYDTGPGTLVHELVHALMAADFPDAPIWISEGMASLFEQCRVDRGDLIGETNWRYPELRRALAEGRVPSLERLLAMTPAAFRAQHESLNYAVVRYFCQYLQERGILAGVYRRFRDHRRADPHGKRALEAVCGQSLAALERDFHAWAATLVWE